MARAWEHYVEPSSIPEFSDILFGPDPSYTPASEDQPKETCTTCGGATWDGKRWVSKRGAADPLADRSVVLVSRKRGKRSWTEFFHAPVVVVCSGCRRSIYDGTEALESSGDPVGSGIQSENTQDKAGATEATVNARSRGR